MSDAPGALDPAGAVRPGEQLDVAAVDGWLRERLPDLADFPALPQVTQFAGGASNWTYRLRYASDGTEGPDLVLRRPPAGTKARSAHDMGREFRIQSALAGIYPYVPEMIGLCEDESVLGAPFYVMRRIPGLIPRKELPAIPDGGAWTPARTRALCENVVDRLVELHRVDVAAAGLESLGKGAGYPRRQVEGWSQRYEAARTWNVPSFRRVRAWLAERIPEDAGRCVIHNDYRFDNVVLDAVDPTRVVGVLDWEMATVGDPLMDLGAALAYWVEAGDDWLARRMRRQPTHLPGMLRRAEMVERYLDATGLSAADWPFYEVYGLFRVAVIAQQIYFRFHHRQTSNPAFRSFWVLVRYFHWRCGRVMAKSRG